MSTRTQYEADLAALKGSLARMSQLSADAVEDALEDNDDVQNVWHSLENEEDLPE